MQHTTTIRRVGNSLGVILPKKLLEQRNLGEGDRVSVALGDIPEAADEEGLGEDFDNLWQEVSKRHAPALKALAKR